MSVARANVDTVEPTAQMIDEIPRGNLHVPRAEFVAVWSLAEARSAENSTNGTGDRYVVGVVVTCRWIAGVLETSSLTGQVQPARAPLSLRTARAHEELIEAETLAAERQLARHPDGLDSAQGWLEAIVATLRWAWRGSGLPPLEVRQADVG